MMITVCLPTYNGQKYVAAAIKSILAQSFQSFECLVVDDSSSDATVHIARSFADPRLRIYANKERLKDRKSVV